MMRHEEERAVDGGAPPPPPPLYNPSKWRKGFNDKAVAAFKDFQAKNPTNPLGMKEEGSEDDAPRVILDKDGNPVSMTEEFVEALTQMRDTMLQEAGVVVDEAQGGDA